MKKNIVLLAVAALVLALAPTAQAAVIQSGNLGSGDTSIFTFTLDDNTTATTTWTAPAGVTSIDLAVVAGGGGGGEQAGGGGGAGGLRQDASYSVTPGTTYNIQVGAGGLGPTWWARSNSDGDNSYFDSFESIGGGYGAGRSWDATTGGSGGGANGNGVVPQAAGTPGQGYAGGLSPNGRNGGEIGAGGGGAGGIGGDAAGTDFWTGVGGAGGIGVDLGSYFGLGASIGDAGYFAGGGGGAAFLSGGSGGLGGGGAGGTFPDATAPGTNGLATTGGGGGGDYNESGFPNVNGSGTGGSGIVILSFTAAAEVVPEPASIAIWSFLGLCLAGYGYRRRRRNS